MLKKKHKIFCNSFFFGLKPRVSKQTGHTFFYPRLSPILLWLFLTYLFFSSVSCICSIISLNNFCLFISVSFTQQFCFVFVVTVFLFNCRAFFVCFFFVCTFTFYSGSQLPQKKRWKSSHPSLKTNAPFCKHKRQLLIYGLLRLNSHKNLQEYLYSLILWPQIF